MSKNRLLKTTLFLSLTAATMHAVNRTIFSITDKLSFLTKDNEYTYKWRFGDISYTKQGSGSPVLLIHDLTCGSFDLEWKYILTELAKNYEVYTIDLPGCGKSDKLFMTYTNFIFVECIQDFIKDIIGKETDVIASGLSSTIPLYATLTKEHNIKKILLVNPPSIKLTNQIPDSRSKFLKKLIEFPIIGTLLFNICNCEGYYNNEFMKSSFLTPEFISIKFPKMYYIAAHKKGTSAKYLFASLIGKYVNFPVERSLKTDIPVHCIFGEFEYNALITSSEYKKVNHAITYEFIDNCKHYPQIEQPENFLQACEKFLSK